MEDISFTTLPLFAGIIASVAIIYVLSYVKRRNDIPLPPGPKGLPLIGNIRDLPNSSPWVTFSHWGEIYGGMVYVSAFGKTLLIVNDATTATELLDKKGKLYSDRPTYVMAGDLVGWDTGVELRQFDQNGPWTETRRQFAQYMGSRRKVIESFSDSLHNGARKFLKRLLHKPEEWALHIRMYSAATALLLGYGYELEREDDELLAIVQRAMDEFSELTLNGAYLVDVIPILRYIPSWFPGAGWKRRIPEYVADYNKMLDVPFEWAENQIKLGVEKTGFVHAFLSNKNLDSEQKYLIKMTASAIYGGASDTTMAGVKSFFLAMVLFPSAQAKAQAEIDAVISNGRLPSFDDRPNLPYVEALYWEVLRFYPFVPLSMPHVLRDDDIHNGYFIPKETSVIPNVWQFMKDPLKYRNPGQFIPERFLTVDGHSPEEDPRNYIFGFGRSHIQSHHLRVCPGRHLADASMWIAMVSVLAAFKIVPSVRNGEAIIPDGKFNEGTIIQPESFECSITARSDEIVNLISD